MKRLQLLVTNPSVGICGFSFVVRILYNVIVAKGYYPDHDALKYQDIAFNMLTNHCYCLLPHSHLQTLDRAPLWPTLIAIIYGILGSHDHFVRLFLCIVGSGTCVLVYLFARDLFGTRIGVFSGLLAAIYPFLYIYDGWLYSESIYTFLLFALCYTVYQLQRAPRLSLMLLSGVLLGLVSLTRPNGLLMLGLFLVWAILVGWVKMLPWRVVAQSAIIVSLILLAFVVPWTVRNYTVTHAFVPIAVGDGTVLLGAYNDKVVGTWYENGYYQGLWLAPGEAVPEVTKHFPDTCADVCEVERDNTYRDYAVQWIQSHLGSMPFLLGMHFVNLWQVTSKEANLPINLYPNRATSQLVVSLMEIITPIVLALAAFGLVVTRKYWHELMFIYFIIALTIVQCIAFYGIPRFRAPLEPMLILLGAGTIWWITELVGTRRRQVKNGATYLDAHPDSMVY